MAQDRPTAEDLLETVRDFLQELLPSLEGDLLFRARVSNHLLGIVARELREGPALDATEHERLRNLLGRDGDLDELNRVLAASIRSGAFDNRRREAFDHVRQTVVDKLRIVNPRYLDKRDCG